MFFKKSTHPLWVPFTDMIKPGLVYYMHILSNACRPREPLAISHRRLEGVVWSTETKTLIVGCLSKEDSRRLKSRILGFYDLTIKVASCGFSRHLACV